MPREGTPLLYWRAMLWFWIGLALSRAPGDYPPNGVTLLQTWGKVRLRWHAKGPVRLQVWQRGQEILSRSLRESNAWVEVERGEPVRWRVTEARGESSESEFSVCQRPEFHADGEPGRRPLGGGGGSRLRVRLSRDDAGMHMILWHPKGREHYLFAQVGLRFRLSARGGAGAPGPAGQNADDDHRFPEPGQDGTSGGNGGNVVISTGSAPWRDYLEVDVSPGAGGKGGKGGAFAKYRDEGGYGDRDLHEANGKDGADGFPGRVETVIQDGW